MISRTLREDIKQSLDKIDYKKVILFGSRARGDYTKESDFDLLVILKDIMPARRKIRMSTLMRKHLAEKMIDADILVKDKKDIECLKNKPGSVVKNALREGVSL